MTKYILTFGWFGLGGRLVTLLSSIKHADLLKRDLIILWNDEMYSNQPYVDEFFFKFFDNISNVKMIKFKDINTLNMSVYPEIWSTYKINQYSKYRGGFNRDTLCCKPTKYANCEDIIIINRNDNSYYKDDIFKYIQPKQFIIDECNKFKKDNFTCDIIGIHIRYGNSEPEVIDRYNDNFLDWFFIEIDKRLTKNTKIFLCTDDFDINTRVNEKYHDKIIKTDKILRNDCFHKNIKGDKETALLDTIKDMFILKDCSSLILSPSLFSNVVFMSSKTNDKIIYSKSQ
jgi:hypothetical protein